MTRGSAQRALVRLMIAFLLVVAGLLVPASVAVAVGEGRIAGRVTDSHGAGLDGIGVRATRWIVTASGAQTPSPFPRTTTTAADGSYELPGLDAGDYQVQFVDDTGKYLDEFWPDTPDWQQSHVAVAATGTTQLDPQLTAAARISGRVTGPDGSALPGEGVIVQALDPLPVIGGVPTAGTWDVRYDGAGGYTVGKLRPGRYVIGFGHLDARYAVETWRDEYALGPGTVIAVTEAQHFSGVDFQLEVGGTFEGRVVDYDGKPVRSEFVTPYRWHNGRGAWEPVVHSVQTRPNGTYTLNRLPPGTYRLGFAPGQSVAAYWKGAESLAKATSFTLTSGQTRTDMDGRLGPLGRVTVTKKPRVTGVVKPRATLRVSKGAWKPSDIGVDVAIQWYAGGKAIPRATRPALKLAGKTLRTLAGKPVSVRVTASASNHAPLTVTLRAKGRIRR